MTLERARHSLVEFGKALRRLDEVLTRANPDDVVRDSAIQRFEFTFELAWKTLKRFLGMEGVEALTPREVLREAYAAGWIAEDERWIAMLNDRNLSSHLYDEESALEIFQRLPGHMAVLTEAFDFLQSRFSER